MRTPTTLAAAPAAMHDGGKEKILAEFRRHDATQSGKLPKGAWLRFMQNIFNGWSDTQINLLFGAADVELDEQVDYCKFVNWLFSSGVDHSLKAQGNLQSKFNRASKVSSEQHLGDPLRALSAHYLSGTLLAEVSAAGQDGTAKIYEVEPTVIRPKGQSVVCPRDGRLGAAYVDCVHDDDNAGMATIMLSYTWRYLIGEVVDTVLHYCQLKQFEPKRTYIWMCCFCINQHRVREAQATGACIPFEEFREEFGGRVKGISHILAMMDCWEGPAYIKRIWCVFELYTAVAEAEQGCLLDIMMPPRQAEDFALAIADSSSGDRLARLWRSLAAVNVAHAEASVEIDRVNIMQLIDTSIGCSRLNAEVVKCLQTWFAHAAEESARCAFKQNHSFDVTANSCTAAAHMLVQLGYLDRAKSLLEAAQQQLSASNALETRFFASILRHRGVVSRRQGYLPEALEYYQKSYELLGRLGLLESSEGVELITNLGNAFVQCKNLDKGLEFLMSAARIATDLGRMNTIEGAMLNLSIGNVKRKQGRSEEALEFCIQAKRILQENDALGTPPGASVLKDIGITFEMLDSFDQAVAHYAQARGVFEAMGTLGTPAGVELLTRLGCVEMRSKNFAEAEKAFDLARLICEDLNLLQSPAGTELLSRLADLKRQKPCML